MGRFYKTAKPQMIDFMYRLPENAILQAIKTTDDQLAQQEKNIYDLYGKLQISALSPDESRKKEILQQYESDINALADEFNKNPLTALQNKSKLTNLSKKMFEDWTRGEVAGIQQQAALRADFKKRYEEEMMKEKGRIIPEQVQNALSFFDNEYEKKKGLQWNPETKTAANQYIIRELASYSDAYNEANEFAKGWIEDASEKLGATLSPDGDYIYQTVNGQKRILKGEILTGTFNKLMSDEKVRNYFDQQIQFGALTKEQVYGERDNEGKLIPIIDEKTQKPILDDQGNIIPKNGGILYNAASTAAEKYDKSETKEGITSITTNWRRKEEFEQENRKQLKQFEKSLEVPAFNLNNNQLTIETFSNGADNVRDITTNLEDNKNSLEKDVLSLQTNLSSAIQNSNIKNKAVILRDLNAKIEEAKKTGNWSKLETFVAGNEFRGILVNGKPFGSGIKEFGNMYNSQMSAVNNQATQVKVIAEEVIQQEAEKYVNQKYPNATENERQNYIKVARNVYTQEYEKNKNMPTFTGGAFGIVGKINEKLKINAQTPISFTSTNAFDWLPRNEATEVTTFFSKFTEKELPSILATNGSSLMITGTDATGKAVSFNDLLKTNNISYADFTKLDENGILQSKGEGGKPVTLKLNTMGITPENIPGVGRNSTSFTLTLQKEEEVKDANNKTKKVFKPQIYTFLIPSSDITYPIHIQEKLERAGSVTAPREIIREGDMRFSGIKNNNNAWIETPEFGENVKYNPTIDGGLWSIKTTDGQIKTFNKTEGQNVYQNLLISGGYYPSLQSSSSSPSNISYSESNKVSLKSSK